MKNVLVFKTSVTKKHEVERLRPVLNKLINGDERWNFDLEDCDRILRFETWKLQAAIVEKIMHTQGYFCEELPD